MSNEKGVGHETVKKRKRLSELAICKRELANCQRLLKEHKDENIRLSNLLAATTLKLEDRGEKGLLCNLQRELEDMKKKLVENRKYVETLKWSHQQSADCLVSELNKYKAQLLEQTSACSFLEAELDEYKEEEIKASKRKSNSKQAVLSAFKWHEERTDPDILRAVTAFWEAFSEQTTGNLEWRALKRRSKLQRMIAWKHVTEYGWNGDMIKELDACFVEKKRFSAVQIAKLSDMESNFNLKVASDLGKCDPGWKKYGRSILPSEASCRRKQHRVHEAAICHGLSSFPVEQNGNVWCWGDEEGNKFTQGVNRYVYEIYAKLNDTTVTKDNPWIIPVTGDLARVSYRGKGITMCGPKEADPRLPSQRLTGKTMNQSRKLYTPAVAGYTSEADMMPYFDKLVNAFMQIEKDGFCTVDGVEYPIHIRCVVVADMSFLHKFLGRGGSSGTTTCFCFMCSSKCHFRHKGYPGGCLKCRKTKQVYDVGSGCQKCLHHDVCTPEFLEWERVRFHDLCARVVPNIPLSKLPFWESVPALRAECIRRCDSAAERMCVSGKSTEAHLQKWLLAKCRQGCTLTSSTDHGVKFCDMEIVRKDLAERNIVIRRGMTDDQLRTKLELVLREEEEWQGMVMYRRDARFADCATNAAYKQELDRTILDMLHCPMRMHEKVLNVLYSEILNGKTKTQVNSTKRRVSAKKPSGTASIGQKVAKLFRGDDGLDQIHIGEVVYFTNNAKNGYYSVLYEDGDREDMDFHEYSEARSLAVNVEADHKEELRLQSELHTSYIAPTLHDLTNCIRGLGSLGASWTHQWDENNHKKLKLIKLPLDQSKHIFAPSNLEGLNCAVDIAVPAEDKDKRTRWKSFFTSYVTAIDQLTRSVEYNDDDIVTLEKTIDECYSLWIAVAGIKGVSNYFHYFGSGHIIWLIRRYGNLWRWRNEGVESENSVLSLRYNKFNNKAGHKASLTGQELKCAEFEVLGCWMGRVSMWALGLADKLFQDDSIDRNEGKTTIWKTGSRIVYADTDMHDSTHLGAVT